MKVSFVVCVADIIEDLKMDVSDDVVVEIVGECGRAGWRAGGRVFPPGQLHAKPNAVPTFVAGKMTMRHRCTENDIIIINGGKHMHLYHAP